MIDLNQLNNSRSQEEYVISDDALGVYLAEF